MSGRWLVGAFAIAMFIGSPALEAQRQRPLAPLPPEGQRVAPFFDGFYENADGTATLSFGYSNLNREELVEIPLGPNNFIEPKEFDGGQPTSFPTVVSESAAGRRSDRRDRERGVFTVTVPAGFKGDVVWTLRHQGDTYSVPGRTTTGAYRLRWPMAMGSVPPLVRFKPNGPTGRGPSGLHGEPMQAKVGTPLSLTLSAVDDSVRDKETVPIAERGGAPKAAMNVTWYKHSGPGAVEFAEAKQPIAELEGSVTNSATFSAPGEYVLRARVDNFGRVDTSAGNQCCWTNGYVKVNVTP